MALRKLEADLSIIAKLGTNPGVDNGLSEEQLKEKFDEAANIIKDYLNNYLVPEMEKTVDVESLLSDIQDTTLSKSDKAANAAATGEAIRGLRSFFEKVVRNGDYVLDTDGKLTAEISGAAAIRVYGGEGVIQGNLFSVNLKGFEDVELEGGTYGLSRHDIIVVRATKDETGALSYALKALTGTETSGEPVDPEYYQSDINGDGSVRDFPLYRVEFDGVYIVKVVPLFEAQKAIWNHMDSKKDTTCTVTLSVSGWADNIQTVAVKGVTSDTPVTVAGYSEDDNNWNAYEECGVRCIGKSINSLIFKCVDVPEIDLIANVMVHR